MAAPPFKVKAIHDYSSPHDEDLNFASGDLITVTEEEDADWYVGEYIDASGSKKTGLFPRNFVERYEPAAPPRPTRSRPRKDAADTSADPPVERIASSNLTESEVAPLASTAEDEPADQLPEPAAEPIKPAPVSASKVPPPVSEKPSSFKDRIAAFNKTAAPPIAPKPAGAPSGQGFIKKPFVAPPPARSSYVPPPKEQAPIQKTYRRDEDPEIVEEQAQAQRDAQAAGLAADSTVEPSEGKEESKPTSLKERIALLQKQQQEQAARRADAGSKEKPKRSAKSDTDSTQREILEQPKAPAGEASSPRTSLDTSREVPKPPLPRTRSRDTQAAASIVSDGNEADQSGAGDTTEDAAEDESTEVDEPVEELPARPLLPARTSTGGTHGRESLQSPVSQVADRTDHEDVAQERNDEEEEEEEEDMDPEVRRKMELRERMAKMSGGMGMPGMFAPMGMGMSGSAAPKKNMPVRKPADDLDSAHSPPPTQRVPMIPVPSVPARGSQAEHESIVFNEPEIDAQAAFGRLPRAEIDTDDLGTPPSAVAPPTPARPSERGMPPPVPDGRPSASEVREVPPPPSRPSDPVAAMQAADENRGLPTRGVPPPVPGAAAPLSRPEGPRSPPAPHSSKRTSAIVPASPPQAPLSPPEERQASRIPPISGASPSLSAHASPTSDIRAPPPPPPTAAPPVRQSIEREHENSDGESEYEGDYDTDIADGAAHKDALKSHARTQSADETLSEGPQSPLQRAAPPPPPHQTPKIPKVETPRGAPPPPPAPRDVAPGSADDDYDPYRHSSSRVTLGDQFVENGTQQASDPSLYAKPPPPVPREAAPPMVPQSPPSHLHNVPPPLPPQHQELPPIEMSGGRSSNDMGRKSIEPRASMNQSRLSMEQGRPSVDQGVIARDVDLDASSMWWTLPNTTPPVFQSRADILYEIEEATSTKRGGRTIVSRDVYVLFHDYSQTITTARFDAKDPANAQLEQRHEPPPPRPSQEALEQAHSQYAGAIMSTASQLVNAASVDGGTPQGLVRKCIASVPGALAPIGTRAYGALVYANLGNASVSQHDEIRPGDIVSFRNARFQGKHGAMHAKYSLDITGEHVAIVSEWDGTKKKVRAWEQGRADATGKVPSKDKVKIDSFKFGDLRSGEIKVWRVMGRSWVGWEGDGQ